jgi:hypothetical protein
MVRRLAVGFSALVGSAIAASSALAQGNPALSVYSGVAGNTQRQVAGAAAGSPSASSGSTLPFTGLNLALAVVLVLLLVGAGIALRRAGRESS